jgi:putative copper resistance protein D
MAFASLDGLLDAIPGIAVMTSSGLVAAGYYGTVRRDWGPSLGWDQTIGGGLMLTIAEVVAVPFIAIVFRAWIHEDARVATGIDTGLDDVEEESATTYDGEPLPGRPWWEVDPGPLADRADRYGWRE